MGAGFQQDSVRVVIAKVIQTDGLGGGGEVDARRGGGLRNFTTGDGDLIVKVARTQALEEKTGPPSLADDQLVDADPTDSGRLDAVEVGLVSIQGQVIDRRVAGTAGNFDEACCGAGGGCGDRCVRGPGQTHFGSEDEGTGGDQIFGIGFQIDNEKLISLI